MSRSYRKPYCKDGYKGSKRKQFEKKNANHKVRHSEDVPNGKAYRKFSDTWNICDYAYYVPKDHLEKWWPSWWKLIRK